MASGGALSHPQNSKAKSKTPGKAAPRPYIEEGHKATVAADPAYEMLSPSQLDASIERLRRDMVEAAKRTDFIQAAQYRDEMLSLEKKREEMQTTSAS